MVFDGDIKVFGDPHHHESVDMNSAVRFVFVLFCTTLFAAVSAIAQTPKISRFWAHPLPINGKRVLYSSPVIAEIDANPDDGLELAVATSDGTLAVFHSDGTPLWSVKTPVSACTKSTYRSVRAAPAVADLYGNGIPYVILAYGGCDGGVAAYRGPDGQRAWTFSTAKFAHQQHFGAPLHDVVSTPAVADVDGDGKMEIGFGSWDRNVYLLNSNGTVRWYYVAADTIWSSAAFADVDGDGKLEMLIGTDISANSALRPPTRNGGYVYAFKTAPRKNKRIFFRDSTAYLWQTAFDQVIFSAPVVADVLPSNPGLEVIVGSGCYFPAGSARKAGRWVKVLDAHTGKVLQTLPTTGCSPSSVAVGDINDDGVLEIVATVNGSRDIGGDGYSRVTAWRADSPVPIWSVIPFGQGSNDAYGGDFMSPVIADLDGNGSLEVIVANGGTVNVFNGRDGSPLTCQTAHCTDNPNVMQTGSVMRGTPAVGDFSLDGELKVVMGAATADGHGGLFAWRGFREALGSPAGLQPLFSLPWPTSRGNPQRTGSLLGN